MKIYFALFLLPCVFYLLETVFNINYKKFYIYLSFFLISLVIGFRHEIGGDWENYLFTFNNSNNYNFLEYLKNNYKHSFLYSFNEWVFNNFNFSIHLLNFFCALIFSYGLIIFCKYQKNIYIGMLVSTPVLVISTGMGFTKQSVAIGVMLLTLSKYKSILKSFLLTLVAMSFHFSSFFIVFIHFFERKINKQTILYVAIITLLAAVFIYDQLLSYIQYYILDKYQGKLSYLSEGAIYRLFLNSIPSVLFIFFYNKFRIVVYSKFWLLISIFNILLFILVVTRPELSSFADRIGLYFLPIQILVFANLEYIISDQKILFRINLITILYYLLILIFWLNFSNHKAFWVPYQFKFLF